MHPSRTPLERCFVRFPQYNPQYTVVDEQRIRREAYCARIDRAVVSERGFKSGG